MPPPAEFFDTQVAAGLCMPGQNIGLANLLHDRVGVALNKAQQSSDWRGRPLTPAQMSYALDDVRYLHALQELLGIELAHRNRLSWLEEDMAGLLQSAQAALAPPDPDKLWLNMRRLAQFRDLPQGRAVLRSLMVWREAAAAKSDLAPPLLLRDETLAQMAKQPPQLWEDLALYPGIKPNTIKCVDAGLDFIGSEGG